MPMSINMQKKLKKKSWPVLFSNISTNFIEKCWIELDIILKHLENTSSYKTHGKF